MSSSHLPVIDASSSRPEPGGDGRGIAPSCAACAVFGALPALATGQEGHPPPGHAKPDAPAAPSHKFDTEIPRKLTYRDAFWATLAAQFLPLAVFLTRSLGSGRATELRKSFGSEQAAESGRDSAARGGNDFAALKRMFSPDFPPYANTITMSFVESTDTAHEIRVTECLWADTCLKAGAGAEGFAAICFGDYAFAKAFNPAFEMVRDKTLMQGHGFCNHRWLVRT